MRLLQRKILVLVISSILISATVVMGIAFFNYNRIVERNSEQIMQLMCSEKRQSIDEKLLNIEHSVHKLYNFAVDQINESGNLWRNEELYAEHINNMKALIETTARYTDGAVSVYYRLDSSIKGPKQGVWMLQNASGVFAEYEMTDISYYDRNRETLYNGLSACGFSCIKPEGAFYLFVKSPIENEKEFCEAAKKYNILIVPGSSFGCSGYVRMAYCVAYETIVNSLPKFKELAKEYF